MDRSSVKYEERSLMNILFQVKKKINLFDKELQFVREGLNKIEKIHIDIISDLQDLGDACMELTSEKHFKMSSHEINIDDDDSDEVIPRSPIKKKLKSIRRNNCMVKFTRNDYGDKMELKTENKIIKKNEIENIDDVNGINAVNDNKYVENSIIKNDRFDETYCPRAEEQLKNEIHKQKLLCTVQEKECIPKDTIQVDLDSYDRVPEKKKNKCVEYACKGPVVRKKSERAKLTGWDCKNCEKWYQSLGLSPKELQKRKNSSSRHRSKYNERYETPPGFWNPTFSQPLSSSDEY